LRIPTRPFRCGQTTLTCRSPALNGDGNDVDAFEVRQCAVFQVKDKKYVYVRTLNKWYVADDDYVQRVESELSDLRVIVAPGFLSPFDSATMKSEGDYNDAAADGKSVLSHG